MAQQSARRGRKYQVYSSCREHAFMIWSQLCELPSGPRTFIAASSEAGQMAASDYVPNFFKNRLHLAGRPQMSARLASNKIPRQSSQLRSCSELGRSTEPRLDRLARSTRDLRNVLHSLRER